MEHKKTRERGFELACGLVDEYGVRRPADDAERHIWWQLLDAGMSVGANSSESGGAESDLDFIHKFAIALKEGHETLYWLRMLAYACPDRAKRVAVLYRQCDEIVAILITSIKTAKTNHRNRKAAKRRSRNSGENGTAQKRQREKQAFWYDVPD